MNKEKLAQTALDQGLTSLVILEGQAPSQHNDLPVIITGNIDAPSRFIAGRSDDFKESKKHCLVSKTDGHILLVLNEQSVVNKYQIQGKIEVAKKFTSLGINNDKTAYTPEELANKLKLLRSMFVSNLEHATICATLRNLKAKVNSEIEKQDDKKGNVQRNFKQTVESNMPDSIKLNIALLEGEDPIEIEVNVLLEANGSDIKCYLESIDAAELIETQFALRVEQEVEKIKDFVTVIFY
jgi:transcriptional regulator